MKKQDDTGERTTIKSRYTTKELEYKVIERYETTIYPISRLFRKSTLITFILKNKIGQMYVFDAII